MQANGAVQKVGTTPRRRWSNVLLAIVVAVVITAAAALLIWEAPLATSGPGTEDANLKAGAGSAVIHDDAGNAHRYTGSAVIHDDAGNSHPN